eukprot:392715-Pyramimonas_sp.AAC.1
MRRAAHSDLYVRTARRSLDVDPHLSPASPWTVGPAYACTAGPIHMLAQAIWSSWIPRESIARLMFASEAAFMADPCKSDWPLVKGPISVAVASCRRIGWRLGPGVCMLLTQDGYNIDVTSMRPRSVLHVARLAIEDRPMGRERQICDYTSSLSRRTCHPSAS